MFKEDQIHLSLHFSLVILDKGVQTDSKKAQTKSIHFDSIS